MNNFHWIIYSGNITFFLLNFSMNSDFWNIFALATIQIITFLKKILFYTFSLHRMKMAIGSDKLLLLYDLVFQLVENLVCVWVS